MSDRNLTEQLLRLEPGMTLTAQRTDDGEIITLTLEQHSPDERCMTSRGMAVPLLERARFDLAALDFDYLLADLQRALSRQKDTK